MRVAKVFVVALVVAAALCFFLSASVSAQQDPNDPMGPDSLLIAEGGITVKQGAPVYVPIVVENDSIVSGIFIPLILNGTGKVSYQSIINSGRLADDPALLSDDTCYFISTDGVFPDTIAIVRRGGSVATELPSGRDTLFYLQFSAEDTGYVVLDTSTMQVCVPQPIDLSFEWGLYVRNLYAPQFYSDTIFIIPIPPDTVIIPSITCSTGVSFPVPIKVYNHEFLNTLKFDFVISNLNAARFDSFSFQDTRLSDPAVFKVPPDTSHFPLLDRDSLHILLDLKDSDSLVAGSTSVINLWYTGIGADSFIIEPKWVQFCSKEQDLGCFIPDSIFSNYIYVKSYNGPSYPDTLHLTCGVEDSLIAGINAKIPITVSAWNDEILSGFYFPFVIKGTNLPSYQKITFDSTALLDTVDYLLDTSYWKEDSALIKLEIKKGLEDTLLADSDSLQKLFDLWLDTDSLPARWDFYTQFLPRFGPLFFINSHAGFTPTSFPFTCSTFYYVPGDVNANDRVNNVDLFYLMIYLFLPPEESSSGEMIYDFSILNRAKDQNLFRLAEISAENETTFSQILFRGDVNGDSRTDMGDLFYFSRHFQVEESETLKYGWSEPQEVQTRENDTLRINLRKGYAGQKVPILVEIYNKYPLSAIDIPLQIKIEDTSKIRCDSIIFTSPYGTLDFDWEWATWDEDYDKDTNNQDLLITVSTLGNEDFPYLPANTSGHPDSFFILWCEIKNDLISDSSYIKPASLLPSHNLSFFDTGTGYSFIPVIDLSFVDTIYADFGDAPDNTWGYEGGFPTIFNSANADSGRQAPFHKTTMYIWLGGPEDTTTKECNAKIEDMDKDSSHAILYVKQDSDTTGYWVVPVSVKGEPDDTVKCFLNVLFDVNRDKEWKDIPDTTEWVVRNKLLRIPSNTTQNIVLGPSPISQPPDSEISTSWAWARFTLTKDFLILQDSIWDGTGPVTGFAHGETEDIYFKFSTDPKNIALFVIKQIPEREIIRGSGQVGVEIHNIGDTISSAILRGEVFSCSGVGDPATILTDSITFTDLPPGDTTVYFNVTFPDSSSNRECEVFWKLSLKGTNLVATDVGELEESAAPYFVFLDPSNNPVSDTTIISYYGGVIDLRFSVVDPDSDYRVTVTFDRSKFSGAVYPPIFADSKSDSTDTVYFYSRYDDTTFYWAVDSADTGSWTAIFEVKDRDNPAWIRYDTLTFIVDTLKPDSNTVWVGREGIIAPIQARFRVPVEIYNDSSLSEIIITFKITMGNIDTLFEVRYFDDSRLSDPNILKGKTFYPTPPFPVVPNIDFGVLLTGVTPLAKGFGKIFDLVFIANDTTHFEIGKYGDPTFTPSGGKEIAAKFQTHIIMVITQDWICGDVNGNGEIELADAMYLANYKLKSGDPPPDPICRANANGDKVINLSDAKYIANYKLKSGPPPHNCENYPPPKP